MSCRLRVRGIVGPFSMCLPRMEGGAPPPPLWRTHVPDQIGAGLRKTIMAPLSRSPQESQPSMVSLEQSGGLWNQLHALQRLPVGHSDVAAVFELRNSKRLTATAGQARRVRRSQAPLPILLLNHRKRSSSALS